MEECIVLENEIYGDAKREIKKHRLKFIIKDINQKRVNEIIKNYEIL